jgi:hypothetical protein
MSGLTRARFGIGATLALSALAACAIEKTPTLIRIEHPWQQFSIAQMQAESYCGELGKKAWHVQTTPPSMSIILIDTSISTFECAD